MIARMLFIVVAFVSFIWSSMAGTPCAMLADSPRKLTGMVGWYIPSISGDVGLSGTNVIRISDHTGLGHDLTNYTALNGGFIETLNGLDVVRFDGNSRYLKTAAYTLNQPCQFAWVGKLNAWVVSKRLMDGDATDASTLTCTSTSPDLGANAGAGLSPIGGLDVGTYGMMSVLFNGANSHICYGAGFLYGNAGANNPGGFTLASPGQVHSAGYTPNMAVAECWVFGRAVTGLELDYLNRLMRRKFDIAPIGDTGIVFTGDSRTQSAYPAACVADPSLSGITISYLKVATGGFTVLDLENSATWSTDASFSTTHYANIVVIWCGRNDAANGAATGATIWTRLSNYCLGRKQAGFKVILCNEIDANTGSDVAWHATERAALDALINANWSSVADGVVDLYSHVELQDANNTTYFTDKVHLTTAGYNIVAAAVAPVISAVR